MLVQATSRFPQPNSDTCDERPLLWRPNAQTGGVRARSTAPKRFKVDQQKRPLFDIEALAWTYTQSTGELQQNSKQRATGYSGAGEGKNNPAMEHVRDVGPIPRGAWTITGPPSDSRSHGPYVLRLEPAAETATHGRDGFLIHGDSKAHPGSASQGCIILPRAVREEIWHSGDRDLEVVAGLTRHEKTGLTDPPQLAAAPGPGVKSDG